MLSTVTYGEKTTVAFKGEQCGVWLNFVPAKSALFFKIGSSGLIWQLLAWFKQYYICNLTSTCIFQYKNIMVRYSIWQLAIAYITSHLLLQ